jgi:Reverse transcriptase (RNA-dependent DNA polymerase)
MKGCTVADGRPQRSLYTKEETTSPTVLTDALILSIMIDTKECCDIATANVDGAYLHATMEDKTLVRLENEQVDIMCAVDDKYTPFVCTEKEQIVLSLRLLKALYGRVKSALLWSELFPGTLVGMGFQLIPYITCVAKKVIIRHQCTFIWYIDNTKIFHVDANVVTQIICEIERKFEKMTVTRGDKHSFLGMELIFNKNGTPCIKMKPYITRLLVLVVFFAMQQLQLNFLFEIDEDSEVLSSKERELFHSIMANLL